MARAALGHVAGQHEDIFMGQAHAGQRQGCLRRLARVVGQRHHAMPAIGLAGLALQRQRLRHVQRASSQLRAQAGNAVGQAGRGHAEPPGAAPASRASSTATARASRSLAAMPWLANRARTAASSGGATAGSDGASG
ncbi:hypothetical protein EHO96_19430 [Bordetella pertussis]|nr:hypothetical protein EHO96_19430 [Bordetella pertussis]